MNLCDIRTVREILAAFGTETKKGFGQNFLINAAVPEGIADACCDDRDSVIVEIGPGRALSDFVKKTVGDAITCLPAEDVPTLTAALEALVAKAAP